MDYEKKYNEAVKRAKAAIDVAADKDLVKGVATTIFPELGESEDERMMREFNDWLCEEIECRTDDLRDEKDRQTLNMLCYILTKVKEWLEKQKELPFVKDVVLGYPGLYYYDGERMHFRSSPAMEEKQKELMPPVNVDPCDASWDAYYQRGLNKGYELGLEAGRKEQKPISTEDMPYVADEHFFEREPADSFKYRLAEYMTKNCKKGEGPYGYSYSISSESILQMAKEELIRRGELEVLKLTATINGEPIPTENQSVDIPLAKWSEEDESFLDALIYDIERLPMQGVLTHRPCDSYIKFLKALRPGWKPTEEQMSALEVIVKYGDKESTHIKSLRDLYEQLKKLM